MRPRAALPSPPSPRNRIESPSWPVLDYGSTASSHDPKRPVVSAWGDPSSECALGRPKGVTA